MNKHQKYQGFGAPKTTAQSHQDHLDRHAAIRADKKYGIINNMQMWLADMDWKDAHPKPLITNGKVAHMAHRAPRAHRRHGEGSRSSAASGDGNDSDSDPDPERRFPPLALYDQASLADLLQISKKTLQNLYSVAPHSLPPAIVIPGARGPRWTPQAVQEWISERPQHHTPKPAAPQQPARKNKVGRPRIAFVNQGGAK